MTIPQISNVIKVCPVIENKDSQYNLMAGKYNTLKNILF